MSVRKFEDDQHVLDMFTFTDGLNKHLDTSDDANEYVASARNLNLILGGPGQDNFLGTDNADRMVGLESGDHFAAGGGADLLLGGTGGDVLDGGPGDDKIVGGKGGDYLIGEWGTDTMSGGAGYNQFAFNYVQESKPGGANRDTITDFTRGQDHLTFTQLELEGSGGYRFIGTRDFEQAGDIRYEAAKDGGINVFVNTDGDNKAELGIHLKGISALSSEDFYF